jgi:uroporphyrinogen decarboxylase
MSTYTLVKALRGEKQARPPLWFMRQAGRYLPEYQAIRAKHSMLDVIRTPELAAEVTLQPLRRYDLDAGIIFADILNPLIGMGMDLEFIEKEGPKILNPVKDIHDIKKLRVPHPEENVQYTLDAIRIVVNEWHNRIPLIGFSGAPLTLSYYMIEGGGGKSAHGMTGTKKFMTQFPSEWNLLQEKLVQLVSEYLIAQAHAGVSALQLFDSWAYVLSPDEYMHFVLPYVKTILKNVKDKVSVPLIYFMTGGTSTVSFAKEIDIECIGVDWKISLKDAAYALPQKCLQGNLDPSLLFAPETYIRNQVKRVVREAETAKSFVFNLGSGILPGTPVESLNWVIDEVRKG